MNLYAVHHIKKKTFDAASKAPEDVFQIAEQHLGAKEIVFYEPHISNNRLTSSCSALFTGIANWFRLLLRVPRGAYVMIQHPLEGIRVARPMMALAKAKGIHLIGLVHDLDSLRQSLVGADETKARRRSKLADEIILKKCDYVICHNEKMKQYLLSIGYHENVCVCLQIFDYLCPLEMPLQRSKAPSIAIAGNLLRGKSAYVYALLQENVGLRLHLYGPNFDSDHIADYVTYHGSIPPEELPSRIEGSFGLVWDGDSTDCCSGKAGAYLRYNNPHKISSFLAAGMPVIVWRESAMARFVTEHNVGVTVDSIARIAPVIAQMTETEYEEKQANAQYIGQQLREGAYLVAAIREVERRIQAAREGRKEHRE